MNKEFLHENKEDKYDIGFLNAVIDELLIVAETDSLGIITLVNARFCSISGYTKGELLGKTHRVINSGFHDRSFFQNMYKTIGSGNMWRGNICNRAKDGSIYWVSTTIIPRRNVQGHIESYVACRFDITAEIEARNQMKQLACRDPLLGVLNRVGFSGYLTKEFRDRSGSVFKKALIIAGLDDFKEINDIYGHESGDAVLREVTQRIARACRGEAVMSRLGGDEFALLLPVGASQAALSTRIDHLRYEIEQPMMVGGVQLSVRVSVGYSLCVRADVSPETLLKEADMALHAAKKAGGHCVVLFTAQFGAAALRIQKLLIEARYALQSGQFQIYYQPVVDLRGRCIATCEALLRWKHPKRGLLTPGAFREVFHDLRLSVGIGRFLRETVARDLARWRKEGHYLGAVAINLTTSDFEGDRFVSDITSLLQDYDLDASSLILEVTETMFLGNARGERVRRDLIALAKRRFVIAFDDFGTGHASLTHLRELPLNVIKLDRSFVTNIQSNERDRQIAIGMIELAHRIDLKVVAEGVEEPEQFRILHDAGCDSIQGFLFSRAVSWGDIPAATRRCEGILADLIPMDLSADG